MMISKISMRNRLGWIDALLSFFNLAILVFVKFVKLDIFKGGESLSSTLSEKVVGISGIGS